MKKLYENILANVDVEWLMRNTRELWKKEFGQCSVNHHQAAEFVENLLCAQKLDHVEKILFPADGKAVCQDKIMPLAWSIYHDGRCVRYMRLSW